MNTNSTSTIASNFLMGKKSLLKSIGDILAGKIQSLPGVCAVYCSDDFGAELEGIEIFITDPKDALNRPAHIRLSFLSNASSCYFEIHPGLENGVLVPKSHNKWKYYVENLNEHFGRNKGNIRNTEYNWGGEWVMDYYVLNNRFTDIINNGDNVVNEVMTDIKIIVDHFVNVQNLIKH